MAVFAFWVLDFKFMETRIQKYTKQMIAIENTSEQYSLLYQAYSFALARYFLKNNLMK